jgi:hypothetical protein
MRIYLATWLEDNQGATLSKAGGDRRLMSYYFLKAVVDPSRFLREYVRTGFSSASSALRRQKEK